MRSFEPDDDAPLDVYSFRALERLAVHEARTEADTWSMVVSHARVTGVRRRVRSFGEWVRYQEERVA